MQAGSSPLTRGKLQVANQVASAHRLIPAHAGKTCGRRDARWDRGAHPRSRGENSLFAVMSPQAPGSSPLTRGKRARLPRPSAGSGLIPAHAGKTFSRSARAVGATAHPRSRGENCGGVPRSHTCGGSSPLTRGKPDIAERRADLLRLIPAHAGKTIQGSPHHANSRAHPRSRGENASCSGLMPNAAGSSPLTRGKPPRGVGERFRSRLIPAHAGKT